jgi:hypothetical protein
METMLGEKIGEESGRITVQRVLPSEGQGPPTVEASFEGQGTILGVQESGLGTYTSVLRPDGTLFGQGEGVIMTEDGEAASWKGRGVGRFTGEGTAVSWRGALYYQTASEKLARLNSVAVVFEFEVDAEGNTQATYYEWR